MLKSSAQAIQENLFHARYAYGKKFILFPRELQLTYTVTSMQKIFYTLFLSFLFLACTTNQTVHAETEYFIQPVSETQNFRFNNENWNYLPHPEVASFIIFDNGEMTGTTTTGVPFEQRIFENSAGVKVHKYSIQDHYHYILKDRIYFSTEGLLSYLERVQLNETI